MPVSRRRFLRVGINSAFLITAGNLIKHLSLADLPVGHTDLALRFAIVSDGHYGQPNTDYEHRHDQMIEWVNAEKEKNGLDFCMINGDLFHNDIQFLNQVKDKWAGLSVPHYVSHGNHDQTDEANWKSVWNLPWHYSFELNDAAVVVLNTADDKDNYICPDLAWTKNELAKFENKQHVFVFMHITPFTWTKGGIECKEVVALFETQKNIACIFHGHDHDQDGVKEKNGKYYFFDSHIAGDWGTNYNGYRMVEVAKNGQIFTYQMNPLPMTEINQNRI